MIRIVTDSCIDFPQGRKTEVIKPQAIVPLSFIISGEHYEDRSITIKKYLELIETGWPTTSAPSTGAFAQAFRNIVSKGDEVLCITISGGLSATINNALVASHDFSDRVRVVDSLCASVGMYYLLEYAHQLTQGSASLLCAAELVELKARKLRAFIAINSIENLRRGGRASLSKYVFSSLLNIKPVVHTNKEGRLEVIGKHRGWKKAKKSLVDEVLSLGEIEKGGVIHVQNPQEAAEIAEELSDWTGVDFDITETGTVIATHTGKDALGVIVQLKS